MMSSAPPSSRQTSIALSHPRSSFPLHHSAFTHQQPKRLRHAESMAQRRIQRGRPSVKHGAQANYGAPKAWQCGWDNNGQGPVCTKSFGRKSDLQRHHHTHTGTRNHACTFEGCGKTFIQTSALTVHMRTHTGEKPHECSVCSKRFSDSSSLARHRKIHSNERPYPCDVEFCDKSFCRKSTLLKHIERDHPHIAASRADEDGWYDDPEISPIVSVDGTAVSEMPWTTSTESLVSPFTTLPSQNFGPTQQQQQQQVMRSPFTTVRQRGTPDPTYRKYPYPNLSIGQVQNISAAELRGFHPDAVVSPPNLPQHALNQVSRVATWSNEHNLGISTMHGMQMQNGAGIMTQRPLHDGQQEYAPRSAPVENYSAGFPYSANHQHRRSASDAATIMFPQDMRDYVIQSQRRSVDAGPMDQQTSFPPYKLQNQQSLGETEQIQLVDEQDYSNGSVDYSQQQQSHEQDGSQSYGNIESIGTDSESFESYQEPQDLGIIAPQTYSLPMGFDLGINAIGFDDDKYLPDTFGETFPSQIIE